ncbi:MAG: hypothetical protein BJ554DRAFT_1557 [Olpidium bornovanus]|uniref:Succinylglutamate desuccinylase/Aspartoacylase catalytic domain-containing protein n=1 Tax=Olpidium bornovanus TaxID=278681 RepID=A0A8H8DH44_9FUNG|nr:MAG: hypothetical protein BJ554DRAFT_1557 [Olpidium bornovanus]
MREFPDGKDLNRAFPGKEDGMASQVYAYQLMTKILRNFDYLIDLHTASFGRVNSYYVRADMNDPVCAIMGQLQQPQIILHNSGQDGDNGRDREPATISKSIRPGNCLLKCCWLECAAVSHPTFLCLSTSWSYKGVMRILNHLNMFTRGPVADLETSETSNTIVCSKGFWVRTFRFLSPLVCATLTLLPTVNRERLRSTRELVGSAFPCFGADAKESLPLTT